MTRFKLSTDPTWILNLQEKLISNVFSRIIWVIVYLFYKLFIYLRNWGVLIGFIGGLLVYHFWVIDVVINHRAKNLNMMEFSAEENKMVPKEEYKWNLKYLKDGTMHKK